MMKIDDVMTPDFLFYLFIIMIITILPQFYPLQSQYPDIDLVILEVYISRMAIK